MAKIAPYFRIQMNDGNGNPLSGGKLYTYEAGTTTPKATYTDASGDTANTNPVILDSNGSADVWLGTGSYKFDLTDRDDVQISGFPKDDILGDTSASFNASVLSTAANLNITTAYRDYYIKGTATLTLSLLGAVDAGEGFTFSVQNTGTGIVTIDPDLSETINGAATLALSPNQWAIVTCDGTNWSALVYAAPYNNLNASAAPTVNDDETDGYGLNSVWFDTTASPKEAYRCLDPSEGAAVWIETTLTTSELGSAAVADLIDDDTMATASSSNIASAESTKAYVDTVAAGIGTTLGTPVTLTTQTAVDFTSIPSGTTKIHIYGYDVSTNGSSKLQLQIGDSGGIETSGYVGNCGEDGGTSIEYSDESNVGYVLSVYASPAYVQQLVYTLHLVNASTNTWMIEGGFARTDSTFTGESIGRKSLSGELTQLRLTTSNGTDQYDAGVFNIRYE